MSIFSNILSKLGFKKPAETAVPAKPAGPVTSAPPVMTYKPTPVAKPGMPAAAAPAAPAAPKPAPMAMVDVVGQLDKLAKGKDLDWKVSIVDLLKLLGIDSSFNSRKELATELGCPANLMNDSAQMNIWLHKTVMQKLAENGGNVPKELLS